ncbi:unnamed protein product [Coffea canephora]|uniref:Disease resistance protein RGA3 n=1 Tax=Coffea canephora TaxID=49390 RepID=A0A068U4H9_COFCA|nr:unnamed protein product [Coffea canephora]
MADKVVDALLGSTVKVLVEKTINLASEQIGLFVGFKKDLEKLKDTLTLIQAVFRDAEEQQETQEFMKRWLENLEAAAFDAGNLLDDINYEMIRRKVKMQNQMKRKVCFFFSLSNPIAFQARSFGLQSQIAPAHKYNNNHAVLISENRETDSVTVGASFVGRDDDVSSIVTQLTATSNNETLSVHPIVGLGGIGKTTVAQKVFNGLNIKNHFDKRMWVCVSDVGKHFDANKLFGLMLEKLEVPMAEVAGMDSREAKVQKLKEMLDGEERNGKKPRKYLLVLDDVWNEDPAPWNRFLDSLRGISSAKGSWILVTTRKEQVATMTAISSRPCSLEKLSYHNCWLILEKPAFGSRETPDDLKELGLELAKKCQGLPLAATVLGGMLCNKGSDVWRSILETGLQNIGGDGESYITKILKLSFDHLPDPALKKCFAYCSIFPQDFQMERNQLIQLWAAEGFLHSDPRKNICMEEVGNRYFTILLESKLFQDAMKDGYGNVLNCTMHDLVHDMVQSISECRTLRLKEPTEADFHGKTFRYLVVERSENPRENDSECNQVLEGLQAHQNLKGLIIESFFGDKLSTWIGELGKLVKFELRNCKSCKELPTLGNMPLLKSLHFEGLDSLTSIDPSFYGRSDVHSGSTSQRPLKLFPALEDLILENMQNLREWMEATVHDGTVAVGLFGLLHISPILFAYIIFTISNTPFYLPNIFLSHILHITKSATVKISQIIPNNLQSKQTHRLATFPVLDTMRIFNCPQLATFPNHCPSLKELEIETTQNGSALMAYICSGVSTLTRLSIKSVNGLTILPNVLFQNNPKLACLELRNCVPRGISCS